MLKYPTLQEVIEHVSAETKVSVRDILSCSRLVQVTTARRQTIFMCWLLCPEATMSAIADLLGVDHSTVSHAIARHKEWLIEPTDGGGPKPELRWRIPVIREMRGRGATWREIGDEIGTNADAAKRWARKNAYGEGEPIPPSRDEDDPAPRRDAFAGVRFPSLRSRPDHRRVGMPAATWAPREGW